VKKSLKFFKNNLKQIYLNLRVIYFKIFKSKVECNICGYQAFNFLSDSWHSYSICPNCGSGIRQRLLWASLTKLEDDVHLSKTIVNKSILHFAPENYLKGLLNKNARRYKTADFFSRWICL
jgi:ribosomal protein L37E